ncbi:MAG: hypothetical protein JSS09_00220 [Verrucomicrobia bacterium]|nr:hypothetical protein [Verrucomicrobiota bacterium]
MYEWDVPYNERPNNPVFLLPITTSQGISNIYIDKKTHDTIIIDGFDTVLFTNKRNIRIGSTIGISRLHGALSDVFTGIPVNRNVLENIKKDPTNLNGELIEEESDGGFLDDESDIELLPDSESQPPEVPFIQSITETTVDITDAGRIITELPPHVRTEQFKSWTIRGTNLQTLSVPSTLETLVLIDTLIGDINIPEEHSLKSLTCNNCPNINLPEHLIVSQLKLKDTPLNPEDVILIVEDLSLINSINNLLSVKINNTEILKLDVSNNSNLRSLPNLPDQIEAINISNTSITELPNIPTSLEKIIVSFGFDLQQIEYMMERGIQVTELPLEEWFRE